MYRKFYGTALAVFAVVAFASYPHADAKEPAANENAGVELTPMAKAMLGAFGPPLTGEPIASEDNPRTDAKVDLGRMLYYDPRFSIGQDISCNSCHMLDNYGVDSKRVSEGHKKQTGTRNSPTVYNAAGHFAQFWDWRSPHVEHQATQPVLNPVEMAMPNSTQVLKVIKSMPGYLDAFKAAFPDDKQPVTYDNFGKAIGAFERGLVTPAPWDRFLAGDADALTNEQKAGYNAFIEAQCHACHMGTHLGGAVFQKVGLVHPWPSQKDTGREQVTEADADKMLFKVPSLRNIAKTGPYFHDGSVDDLGEAVKMMAWHQRGMKLTDAQTKSIVKFLEALTGDLPEHYIKRPKLPESTDQTPKPDLN